MNEVVYSKDLRLTVVNLQVKSQESNTSFTKQKLKISRSVISY